MEKIKMNTMRAKENVGRVASEERQKINNMLETVDEKIHSRRNRHSEFMETIKETARVKNVSRAERLKSHRSMQVDQEEERFRAGEEHQRAQTIKLRNIYKVGYAAWTQFKEERQEYYKATANRKGDNTQAIRARNKQIMVKLQRSQRQVEEYIAARNHETMLKQELRKLREEDTKKEMQRQRRLNEKEKRDIIAKEKQDTETMRTIREREKKLIDTRYENLVRTNIEKGKWVQSLGDWASQGFSTSRTSRKRLNMTQSPGLHKLAKDALSPLSLTAVKKDAD